MDAHVWTDAIINIDKSEMGLVDFEIVFYNYIIDKIKNILFKSHLCV